MAKSFKSKSPLDNLTKTTTQAPTADVETTAPTKESKTRAKRHYMNLDTTGLELHIEAMAKYSKVSNTKYIRGLIEADMKAHESDNDFQNFKNLYEKLL